MIIRIIIDILLLVVAVVCPWWLTLVALVGLLFVMESFYEILVIGFIIDSLYSMSLSRFFNFQYVFTLVCLILFVLSYPIKARLRIYQ